MAAKDIINLILVLIMVMIMCNRVFSAAAAAKSLQSCPTLCDGIDGSPPGSPVPGILQARIFRLKSNKVGKTTRQFRYDLNQIPNDYTVEVRNRFKGLELIDREPDELWTEVRGIV